MRSLRNFYDTLEAYVRGLSALGKESDAYGDLLVCILLDKMTPEIRKNITRQNNQDVWTLDLLRTALKSEIRVIEAGQSSITSKTTVTSAAMTANNQPKWQEKKGIRCAFCSDGHYSSECTKYKTVGERTAKAKEDSLCFICLRTGHNKGKCTSRKSCWICNKQPGHHTALHSDASVRTDNETSLSAAVKQGTKGFTFLKTAVAKAGFKDKLLRTNILIDEGSQRSFITNKLASALKLKNITMESLVLSGFAATTAEPDMYRTSKFFIINQEGKKMGISAIIVDHIVDSLFDKPRKLLKDLPNLKKLKLAHQDLGEPVFNVDILIGADHYWSVIKDGERVRGPGPTAVRSTLGYLVSGPLTGETQTNAQTMALSVVTRKEEDNIARLWDLETLGIFPNEEGTSEALNYADKCIEYRGGRYVARFPWKEDFNKELPTNLNKVEKMTRAIVRRLKTKENCRCLAN